jgi:hypothetical protein
LIFYLEDEFVDDIFRFVVSQPPSEIVFSLRLYRRELPQRDCESAIRYRTAKKLLWRVFAPNAGDDSSGGGRAHPADASGPALVNAPGAHAYPLINYEYAVVSTKQSKPAIAGAIKRFLLWAIAPDETNEKYLQDAHFIPLPAHIWVLSYDQIQFDQVERRLFMFLKSSATRGHPAMSLVVNHVVISPGSAA